MSASEPTIYDAKFGDIIDETSCYKLILRNLRPSLRGQAPAARDAGFIILDGIRMLCEKMYTLILHFNFYTNIILVFKYIKGILLFLDLKK